MDGASTDKTLDIIKEFAAKHPNIIYRSEPDKGQWDALDKALALAKGEYITMLCGQDGYLNQDWFARCAEVLDARPEVSLVWGIPFNMSEDGKLLGPHYAYGSFLSDPLYPAKTQPMGTLVAKIDWRRPASFKRLWYFARKLTPKRALMVLKSFTKQPIPQKEDWFFYWLKTSRAFPEGNMVMRKSVYVANTRRFPAETKTNAALLDFCFDFNAKGYLSYGLPLAASFGRSHAVGQDLRQFDAVLVAAYKKRIEDFKKQLVNQKTITFIDPAGKVVSNREVRK